MPKPLYSPLTSWLCMPVNILIKVDYMVNYLKHFL